MHTVTLYGSPGACSLVSMIALEHAQIPYTLNNVILAKGEHKRPEYLAVNPKGKVPVLTLNGRVITETPAILIALNSTWPQARLFPESVDSIQRISDLSYLASGVHPLVTRYCRPDLIAGHGDINEVKTRAENALAGIFNQLNSTLSHQAYWYSDSWSAMDAYWFWVIRRLTGAGFQLDAYQHVAAYFEQMHTLEPVELALKHS
jgi:glutathione S-transferase